MRKKTLPVRATIEAFQNKKFSDYIMESLKSSLKILRILLPNSFMTHEKEEQMETTTKYRALNFLCSTIDHFRSHTNSSKECFTRYTTKNSTEPDVFNPLLCVRLLNSGGPTGAANRPGIAGLQLRTRRPPWLTRTKFVPSAGNVTTFSRQFCLKNVLFCGCSARLFTDDLIATKVCNRQLISCPWVAECTGLEKEPQLQLVL